MVGIKKEAGDGTVSANEEKACCRVKLWIIKKTSMICVGVKKGR